MSSESAITEADRRKMGEILATSRARSAAIRENQEALKQGRRESLVERGIYDEVAEYVREIEADGRAVVNVREASRKLPLSATEIGMALSMLGDEGRLELASSCHPKSWRIVR